MFVLANLIGTLATILDMALGLYTILIFGRVILSWISADPYNPIVQILYQTTEPVLRPIRQRVGIVSGMDLSPMILLVLIVFLRGFLVRSLLDLAARM
ncbi:MAG: YggT family protein [Acidobacteria bacterium]|nr:YggT family protein [Acidobacteriota bacterium]